MIGSVWRFGSSSPERFVSLAAFALLNSAWRLRTATSCFGGWCFRVGARNPNFFNWVLCDVRVQVASVPEDCDTADALRSVMHRLTAEDFLVVSGDLVSDVPIGAVAAAHRRQGALVTALLCNRASLGSSEPAGEKTKREPVSDIIGLDETQQHLLYVSPGQEVSLKASYLVPLSLSVF